MSVDPIKILSYYGENYKVVITSSELVYIWDTIFKLNGSYRRINLSPPQVAISDPFRFWAISYISTVWYLCILLTTIEGISSTTEFLANWASEADGAN